MRFFAGKLRILAVKHTPIGTATQNAAFKIASFFDILANN
jgi:hypothetical protein